MRKNKIRILHVAQAAGGVDRYIRMLLKYLDKEKFENILVCSQDFHEEDYRGLVDSFEQVEMIRAIGGNDLKAIKEVRTLIKKYNPDIVYEDFAYITVRSLAFQILSIILMFAFVKSENGLYIYAFICVLAGVGGYVCNYLHSKKYVRVRLTKNVELKKHLRPLLFFFFSNLTTTIFVNSDQTMLGLLSGDYYVGIYAVAVKIYNILKNIFTSILVVVMPRVCVLSGQDEEKSQHELSEIGQIFLCLNILLQVHNEL